MYTRYSIGITNKRDLMDQKRNTIHIRAGNSNFWMMKLTKKPILPKCQVPNGFFLYNYKFQYSRIEVFRNCSAFFVSQFFWWEVNLKGLRGNLKLKSLALAKQNHFNNLFTLIGNQLRVQVLPRFDRTTQYFDELDLGQRKCKLPHETEGFVFLKEYSRHRIYVRTVRP